MLADRPPSRCARGPLDPWPMETAAIWLRVPLAPGGALVRASIVGGREGARARGHAKAASPRALVLACPLALLPSCPLALAPSRPRALKSSTCGMFGKCFLSAKDAKYAKKSCLEKKFCKTKSKPLWERTESHRKSLHPKAQTLFSAFFRLFLCVLCVRLLALSGLRASSWP